MEEIFIPPSQINKYETGDVLRVDSFVPLVDHFAVVFEKDGQLMVADNRFISGVVEEEALCSYVKRRTITGVRKNDNPELTNDIVVQRIEEGKKKNYNFWGYNCEKFVHQVCGYCSFTRDQRINWAVTLGAVIFLILFIVSIRKN